MGARAVLTLLVVAVWTMACSQETPSDPITPEEDKPIVPFLRVEGVVMEGGSVAPGVTVQTWSFGFLGLSSAKGWQRMGWSSVTDANGVYRFDISEQLANWYHACEGTGAGEEGWLVATTRYWSNPFSLRPPASTPLISRGQCVAGRLISGPSLVRIPCEGRFLADNGNISDCPELAVELVSPDDGAVFDHVPRTTVLVWHSVPGARDYWYTWAHGNPGCTVPAECEWLGGGGGPTATTTATFEFGGAQFGRWTVLARKNGFTGRASVRYFQYVR